MSRITGRPPAPESRGSAASEGHRVAPVGPLVTTIEARGRRKLLGLAELSRYRELLYFLVWRDIKVRYKQTFFGAAWALLQPLATMAILVAFLGRVARSTDVGAEPYPVFVLSGLLVWMLFSSSVATSSNSLSNNERLVSKVYFPRLLVPISAVAGATVDFLLALLVTVVLAPFFGVAPHLGLLALPLIIALILATSIGLGILLSALTIAFRDLRQVVPFALQLWMFATPLIFLQSTSALSPKWVALLKLNPVHGLVVNFRAALLGGSFDLPALGISATWALIFGAVGLAYFRRIERTFADII